MARVARPHQRKAAAKAGKVMRRRVGSIHSIDDIAVYFVDYLVKHADAGALCAVYLLQTRAVGEKRSRAPGSGACDRATRTPHITPHAHGVD